MYSVLFLNEKDMAVLKKQLVLSIENWLKDYTFTEQVSVEISKVRLNDFLARAGVSSVSEKGLAIKYCDSNFKWESLVFANALHLCPRDSIFSASLVQIKQAFLKEILDIEINKSTKESEFKLFPSAIDAYLQVRIENTEIGTLDFFASHSFFASMIGKSAKVSNKIDLEYREAVIKKIKVPINFSLDFGEISFENLLKMEVGSVFVSTLPLDNQFSVGLCDVKMAVASMGQKSNNLAFLLKGKSA
jgi:hypothetical protein